MKSELKKEISAEKNKTNTLKSFSKASVIKSLLLRSDINFLREELKEFCNKNSAQHVMQAQWRLWYYVVQQSPINKILRP